MDAAKLFYEQIKDLTQHGRHDHPTDRIVLDDTAATLALELGAENPAHRAGSLSATVILPGSGDTFLITVNQAGAAVFKSEHDGRSGQTSGSRGDPDRRAGAGARRQDHPRPGCPLAANPPDLTVPNGFPSMDVSRS